MMFKALRRLLCLALVLCTAFLYLVVTRGGEPLRRFGERAETGLERAGKQVKGYSDDAAEHVERFQEATRDARESVRKLRNVGGLLSPGQEDEKPREPGAAGEHR